MSRNGSNINFFEYGSSILPSADNFIVEINGLPTSQKYTAITFKAEDEVTIRLVNRKSYFPYFCLFTSSGTKTLNYVKSILSPLPTMYLNKGKPVTNFFGTFYGCEDMTSISENLFVNNAKASSFSLCFYSCTNLTTIPDLFSNNINVTDFSQCFSACKNIINIAENLFANSINVTSFNFCFNGCTSITTIPPNLFANNINATSFNFCFNGCTNFKNNTIKISSPNVTSASLFCTKGTNNTVLVPANSTTYTTFSKLTDYVKVSTY